MMMLMRSSDRYQLCELVEETVTHGHQVLVFCHAKKKCARAAETLANSRSGQTEPADVVAARGRVLEEMRRAPGGLSAKDEKVIRVGIAVHTASYTTQQRRILEVG